MVESGEAVGDGEGEGVFCGCDDRATLGEASGRLDVWTSVGEDAEPLDGKHSVPHATCGLSVVLVGGGRRFAY